MKHECHWPDCTIEVPPAMWGCKKHWFTLPLKLRQKVWAAYVPGQELTKHPSKEYLDVIREVREWIRDYKEGKFKRHITGKQTGGLNHG